MRLLRLARTGALLAGAVLLCAIDCATPTALTVEVYSEVACAKGATVALVGGRSLSDLATQAPSSVSTVCTSASGMEALMGSVVLVPAGAKNETIAFAVMTRPDGQSPDTCLDPTQASACIVAKRELRFIPRTELDMRVDLRLSCLGVACSADDTCVNGACVAASVPPSACVTSCDEGSLVTDGGAPDAATDGGALDADATVYASLTDPSHWQFFNPTVGDAGAPGFFGAAFDGRYVYFVPAQNGSPGYAGTVTRYDTQASFTAAASWSTFDVTSVNADANGFFGTAFDGRYVYFAPFHNQSGFDGVVARYDTQSPFNAAASWSTFDVAGVNPKASGFFGAVFDGRYVYLVPHSNGAYDGVVTRFDTQSAFTAAASWATFDTTTVNAGALGFSGATFDGRYVYFVPLVHVAGPGDIVTRYDTTGAFASTSSWSAFDVATVNPGAEGFSGAVFDGRYVSLVPQANEAGSDGLVAHYDTQAPFASASSWSIFDVGTVNPGAVDFAGGAFDGRFTYFVPVGQDGGVVARLDTLAAFDAGASWSTFDTRTLNPSAKAFLGAAFDGRYVYLIPIAPGGPVARFDAKTPPSIPGIDRGSFF